MKFKIAVLILAAGGSTRFKSNKLVALFQGKPIIQFTIQPYLDLDNEISIIVITGAHKNSIQESLDEFDVTFVHNEDHNRGMTSSIEKGIKFITQNEADTEMVLIHPADIPFVTLDDLESIIKNYTPNNKMIIIPSFKQRRGHPIAIDHCYFDALLNLDENRQGLRGFLKENEGNIHYTDISNQKILYDIDTPEDLDNL